VVLYSNYEDALLEGESCSMFNVEERLTSEREVC
jgi:hypothetical protein